MNLSEARKAAYEVIDLIGHTCEQIEIVGSVRRGKPEPKDIEVLVAPKFSADQFGLFDDGPTETVNQQLALVKSLLANGTFEHRPDKNGVNCCGAGMQRLRYRGVALDIFGVIAPSQWGVVKAIRTGPADFTRAFVTQRCEGGRILQTGMRIQDGGLYDRGVLIPTPTEKDFFEAIGTSWVNPEDRI